MKVTIDLPDRQWFLLGEIAERQGVPVAWLVDHAIRGVVGDETARLARARARRDRVVALARSGMTDAAICERTGETRGYVAGTRRAADLPANRQSRAAGVSRP